MDRRALLRGGVGVVALAALSGCLDTTLDAVHGDVEFVVSFHRLHPADRPLVAAGLGAEGTRDRYAQLLTAKPQGEVFTDAVADNAPEMYREIRSADYGERFLLLAELRFPEPTGLRLTQPVDPRWKSWRRLRIPATARPVKDPEEGLSEADSVVATMLATFAHDGTVPEFLAMPISDLDGNPVATLWAT